MRMDLGDWELLDKLPDFFVFVFGEEWEKGE